MKRVNSAVSRQPLPASRAPEDAERNSPETDSLTYFSRIAICGLFVIALFTVMKIMASLLLPVIAAVIVGSVLSRVGERLSGWGLPRLVVGLGLVALTGLVIFVFVDALLEPFSNLIEQAPSMIDTLIGAINPLLEPINAFKNAMHLGGPSPSFSNINVDYAQWFSAFLGGVTPALGEFFVFFASLAFFVVGRVAVRKRMIMAWHSRRVRLSALRIINAIEEALELYFVTIAMIYSVVGVLTGIVAYVCGLSSPMLWGSLAFVLSFVPYFGPALITLALAAGGVVMNKTLGWGLAPAVGFLAVHLVSENVAIPMFLGRRLEINPFIVFISIIFWAWMWGPIGAILAVPLLLIGETILAELRTGSAELPA